MSYLPDEDEYNRPARRNHTTRDYEEEGRDIPQPTPINSPNRDDDPETVNPYTSEISSKPAIFKVIKNPPSSTGIPSQNEIYYNEKNNAFQPEYDDMLDMNKRELFENFNDEKIKKLISSMGGIENFTTHFQLSNGEFDDLFPELKLRKTKKYRKENFNFVNYERSKRPKVLNQGEIKPQRGKIIEIKAVPPVQKNQRMKGNFLNPVYQNYPQNQRRDRRQPLTTIQKVERIGPRSRSPLAVRYGERRVPIVRVSTDVSGISSGYDGWSSPRYR